MAFSDTLGGTLNGALVSFPHRCPDSPHRRTKPLTDVVRPSLIESQLSERSYVAQPGGDSADSKYSPPQSQGDAVQRRPEGKDQLKSLLRMIQLPSECDKALAENDIKFVYDLEAYDEAELMKIGFKKLHAQRLLKAVSMRQKPASGPSSPLSGDTLPAGSFSPTVLRKKMMVRYDLRGASIAHLTESDKKPRPIHVFEFNDDELCMTGRSPLARTQSQTSSPRVLLDMEQSPRRYLLPSVFKTTSPNSCTSWNETKLDQLSSSAAWSRGDPELASGRLWRAQSADFIIHKNRRAASTFRFPKALSSNDSVMKF